MLAERLKELEAEGLITRTVVPETPVRVAYELTEKGRALNVVVDALGDWADRWIGPCPETSQGGKAGSQSVRRSGGKTLRR